MNLEVEPLADDFNVVKKIAELMTAGRQVHEIGGCARVSLRARITPALFACTSASGCVRGRGTGGQNGPQADADALRHPGHSATA